MVALNCLYVAAYVAASAYALAPVARDDTIVGGSMASLEKFPFVASLRLNDKHMCSGTLIGPNKIVTAAQCFDREGTSPGPYTIHLGDLSSTENSFQSKVLAITAHPYYFSNTLDHDIAVVTIEESVAEGKSAYINPISLPQEGTRPMKGVITMAGWGYTKKIPSGAEPPQNIRSNTLQSIVGDIVSREDCKNKNEDFGRIFPGMFCTGNYKGNGKYKGAKGKNTGKGSCYGDAGGPVLQGKRNRRTFVGTISWGIGCGDSDHPDVQTYINDNLDFINDPEGFLKKGKQTLRVG